MTHVEPTPGPTADPARILVAGDIHGDLRWLGWLCKFAAETRCEGILQVGDFGLWPDQRSPAGINDRWMTAVAERFTHHGLWLRILDGNHDYQQGYRDQYPATPEGIRPIRSNVVDWADRGSVWTWNDVRFGALGGAVSIDRSRRTEGRDLWSATEATSRRDVDLLVQRAGEQGVDVLVSHDAPILPGGIRPLTPPDDDPTLAADCAANIALIDEAVQRLNPYLILHGHYHLRSSSEHRGARIEGLASNIESTRRYTAFAVLELANGRCQFHPSETVRMP